MTEQEKDLIIKLQWACGFCEYSQKDTIENKCKRNDFPCKGLIKFCKQEKII